MRLRLYCESIVSDDVISFDISEDTELDDLESKIIERYSRVNSTTAARTVTFWRLLHPVPIQPTSELSRRIANTGTDGQKVSFSEKARDWCRDDVILLVVKVNLALAEFRNHRRARSWLAEIHPRTECVNNLFQQAIEEKFVLVRGTPGSGKSMLMHLLKAKIEREMPETLIEVFLFWTPEKEAKGTALDQRLDYGSYRTVSLQEVKHYLLSSNHELKTPIWLLFDEAQATYWDTQLWITIFKSFQTRRPPNLYMTLFASYESPTQQEDPCLRGTLHRIPAHALMGLFRTKHVTHALQFTSLEYSSFIRGAPSLPSRSWPVLDQALQEFFFVVSNGHIGAIETLLNMAAKAKKDPECRDLPYLSYDAFFKCFQTLDEFMDSLKIGSGSFYRGLPSSRLSLFPAEYSDILRDLIAVECGGVTSYLMFSSLNDALKEAAENLKRIGWIYTFEVADDVVLKFPSPLHRAWFSNHLHASRTLPPPYVRMPFDEFWQTVLKQFSPAAFTSQSHLPNPTYVEAGGQFRNEFYRSIFSITNGACAVTPEYGQEVGKQDRIDFYIGSRRWGIELLREDDWIQEPISRFEEGGAYHPWLKNNTLEDFVILYFSKIVPTRQYPKRPELYHVVYNDEFTSYQLYDHMAEPFGDRVVLVHG